MEIIVRVVPMIGRRGQDGVQIDRRDAQVLEVVEMLDHTKQIPALEAERGRGAVPWFEV